MLQSRNGSIVFRTVLKFGPSYYINLPKKFVDRHNIVKGQVLPVIGDQILKVYPMNEE